MTKNDNNSSKNLGVSVFTPAREKMEANLDENSAKFDENHKICAQNLTKFIRVIPASASFIKSAQSVCDREDYGLSEVAFLGRSNVGKSSLINALVGQNGLAKSSQTPGKTQLINFFSCEFLLREIGDKNTNILEQISSKKVEANLEQNTENGAPKLDEISAEFLPQKLEFILVDLPGFGYAKVSKSLKNAWQRNLDEFLRVRTNIKLFIHLIDSRQFDTQIDAQVSEYLQSFLRPDQKILNFYTKCDKLGQKERAQVLKHDKSAFFVSSSKKIGIDRARAEIYRGILGL